MASLHGRAPTRSCCRHVAVACPASQGGGPAKIESHTRSIASATPWPTHQGILLSLGRIEEAREHINRFIATTPHHARYLCLLSSIGKHDASSEIFARVERELSRTDLDPVDHQPVDQPDHRAGKDRHRDHEAFLRGIEAEIGRLGALARDGKLAMEDMQGGTFTITNGGVYGSLMSTPILNPPQSGVLGMHRIEERPVVVDGKIVARPMMYLALSYDHRIVDGKEAVTFLVRVKENLEDPQRTILDL